MKRLSSLVVVVMVVVMAMSEAPIVVEALVCNVTNLLVCAQVVLGQPPSPLCCSGVNGFGSCICLFLTSPEFIQFVPFAKQVLKGCGQPYPPQC